MSRLTWIRTHRNDRHLSSAIDRSLLDFIVEHQDNPNLPSKYLLATKLSPKVSPHGWLCLHDTIKRSGKAQSRTNIERDLNIAIRVTSLSMKDHMNNKDYHIDLPRKLPPDIEDIYSMRLLLEKIRNKVGRSTDQISVYNDGFRLDFIDDTVLFFCITCGCHHWEPYTSFLCLYDVICGNFTSLFYSFLRSFILCDDRSLDVCRKTLENMWCCLRRNGNDAHTLFRSLPGLATGAILRDHDKIEMGRYLESILDGLDEKLRNDELVDWMTRETVDVVDKHLLLECSGLWKMAGHPVINHDKGLLKVRKEGDKPKENLAEVSQKMTYAFRSTFCREYYRRTGRWPKANVSKCPTAIKTSYYTGSWREHHSAPWPPSYFKDIIFKKTFDFDMHPDISELMSDTSIMGGLSQWHYEASPNWAHMIKYGRGYKHRRRRYPNRVLLDMLTEENKSLEKILQHISDRRIPEDSLVIGLVPKERENKIGARYFAKCPGDMRLWQVATEKAIATDILRNLRYQSMTMTDDVLQNRLLNMSGALMKDGRMQAVSIILDFSSWNLQFRHETVTDLLQDIDKLHGLDGVFNYTHLFPMSSYILIKDPGNPIEEDPVTGRPRPGDRCFYGQESFFEGMRQKGWTLFTICLILSVAIEMWYKIDLLGQGDNQAIIVYLPKKIRDQPLKVVDYIGKFCDKLSSVCDSVQIPLKQEETWRSSILFEYARVSFLEGAHVSSAMKKSSRIASESNNSTSSLSSDLSGVGSLGVTIAGSDFSPIPAFILAKFEELQILRECAERLYNKCNDYLCSLLLMGRIVGGFPIVQYHSYTIRGCPDELTENLHLLRTAWDCDGHLRPYIRSLLKLRPSVNKDPVLLIQDPASLSLTLPVRPENQLKEILRETVRDMSRNSFISELFSFKSDIQKRNLVNDLMSIQPRNPRVLNFIYNSSNVGLQDRMIGRFSSPLTITKASAETITTYPELWGIIKSHDENLINHYDCDGKTTGTFSDLLGFDCQCSFEMSTELRTEHWGPLDGVTMPCPQEQFKIVPWDSDENTGDAIRIRVVGNDYDCFFKRGPCSPYIGADTKEKIRRPPLSVTGTTSLVRSAIRVSELMPWITHGEDSNLVELMKTLILEKEADIKIIESVSGIVSGGSLYHRLRDHATDHGARVNSTHTFGSHVSITTDTFTKVARLAVDYTIFFQQVKCYAVSYMRHQVIANKLHLGDYAMILNCSGCTVEITDPVMKMPDYPGYCGLPLPIPKSTIIVRKNYREPTFKDYTNPQHLLSLAMARLSLTYLIPSDTTNMMDLASQSIPLFGQSMNITDLSNCDPKTYMFYLSLYTPRGGSISAPFHVMRNLLIGMTESSPICILTRYLHISGLLSRIFISFNYRGTYSDWCDNIIEKTKNFYTLLINIRMTVKYPDVLPNPPLCTSTDSDHHINFVKKLFKCDPKITPDPDTLIGLTRKRIMGQEYIPKHEYDFILDLPELKEEPNIDGNKISLHYMGSVLDTEDIRTTTFMLMCKLLPEITSSGTKVLVLNDETGFMTYFVCGTTSDPIVWSHSEEKEDDVSPNNPRNLPIAFTFLDFDLSKLNDWNLLHSGSTNINSDVTINKIVRVCPNPDIVLIDTTKSGGDIPFLLTTFKPQIMMVLTCNVVKIPSGYVTSVYPTTMNIHDNNVLMKISCHNTDSTSEIDPRKYLNIFYDDISLHDNYMMRVGFSLYPLIIHYPTLFSVYPFIKEGDGKVGANPIPIINNHISSLVRYLEEDVKRDCNLPRYCMKTGSIVSDVHKSITILLVCKCILNSDYLLRSFINDDDEEMSWHLHKLKPNIVSVCTNDCSKSDVKRIVFSPKKVLLDNLPFISKLYMYMRYLQSILTVND